MNLDELVLLLKVNKMEGGGTRIFNMRSPLPPASCLLASWCSCVHRYLQTPLGLTLSQYDNFETQVIRKASRVPIGSYTYVLTTSESRTDKTNIYNI